MAVSFTKIRIWVGKLGYVHKRKEESTRMGNSHIVSLHAPWQTIDTSNSAKF